MSSAKEGSKRGMKFHYDPVTASVFTAAWWMPLVCVFLNDNSSVLDTEMTEYPYVILLCLENLI